MAFYIYKNEQHLGPFDQAEVGARLADGTFIPSDSAWNEQIQTALREMFPNIYGPNWRPSKSDEREFEILAWGTY
jgi:hypothetical protein